MRTSLFRRLSLPVVGALAATIMLAPPAAADPSLGSISGTLTTSTGAPSPYGSATLWTASQGYVDSAQLDGDGRYRFADLPAGSYKIEFWAQANLRQWVHHATSFETADAIVLVAGEALVVDESLRPTGALGGRLTRASGAGVEGASVTVTPVGVAGEDQLYADTDVSGYYRLPVVFSGSYKIEFQLRGGLRQFAQQKRTFADADAFTVVAGQETTVDDVLLPTGSIAGRFLDRSGNPLGDVWVEVTGAGSTARTTTDVYGSYRVDDLLPDDYVVSFSERERAWRQYAVGRTREADADRVAVTAGGTAVVDDRLLPGGGLRVTAHDSVSGLPLSDFCVYLEGAGNRRQCAVGPELVLADLAPGSYRVYASADAAGRYLNADFPVTVASGQVSALDMPLVLGGSITTVVVDAVTGAPVLDACVTVAAAGTGVLRPYEFYCAEGTDTISVPQLAPGEYNVFVRPPAGSGLGAQWVGASGGTGDAVSARRIAVTGGADTTVSPVRLDAAGAISGVVRSAADGSVVTNGLVALHPHDWSGSGSLGTVIDTQGRYTIDWLGPYRWPLVFDVAGHARQWSGGTGNRLLARRTLVTAGATATYDVRLQVGTALTGVVRDQHGELRPGASVYAYNAVTGEEVGRGADQLLVVGPQVVKVKAEAYNGYGYDVVWYDDDGTFAAARPVVVSGRGTRTLDFVVPLD